MMAMPGINKQQNLLIFDSRVEVSDSRLRFISYTGYYVYCHLYSEFQMLWGDCG